MSIQSLADQPVHLWSLAKSVVVEFGRRTVLVDSPQGAHLLAEPSQALCEALRRMLLGPVAVRNLLGGPDGADRTGTVPGPLLDELEPLQHLVVRTLAIGARPLLSVVPLSTSCRLAPLSAPGPRYGLDGSIVVSAVPGGLRLQSPSSPYRVDLHSPESLELLGTLVWTRRDVALRDLPAEVLEVALSYLVSAHLVVAVPGPPGPGAGPGTLPGA